MRKLLIVPLLLALSMAACASTKFDFGQLAPWTERQFVTNLPEPFLRMTVSISSDNEGNVEDFRMVTAAGEARLPSDALKLLSKVSTPEVTYEEPDEAGGKNLRGFSVHVEFGDFQYSERFKDSFQRIARWKVDQNMQIRDFEIIDYQ